MQFLHRRLIVLLLTILTTAFGAIAQQQDWLSYYPAVARLQGKLMRIEKFGKPSYGENPDKDERVEVPILILPSPVRIKASSGSSINNESLTNVSFVQAIFPPEMAKSYAQHFDQEIVLAGNLLRGHKGEHFTDVVMQVKAINPTGKPLY
jgi:hypothetical protein